MTDNKEYLTQEKPMDPERPCELILNVEHLDNKDISNILKETKYLDSRGFKKGNIMKIVFSFENANRITVEQFADLMYDSTHRHVTGYTENGMICYKFSKEKDKNPMPRTDLSSTYKVQDKIQEDFVEVQIQGEELSYGK